jgi:SepF-like predicted cell division protein (DUF552 family)
MPFNLFHRKKQPEQEAPAPATVAPEEPAQHIQETAPEPVAVTQPAQETAPEAAPSVEQTPPDPAPAPELQPQVQTPQEQTVSPAVEETPQVQAEPPSKTYLKAMPLKELSDVEKVKADVTSGNIIILRITPLASKSIEDVKTAVNDLFQFAESIGGDIARLGEERVVICPKTVRIWREKTPVPVPSNQTISTAA